MFELTALGAILPGYDVETRLLDSDFADLMPVWANVALSMVIFFAVLEVFEMAHLGAYTCACAAGLQSGTRRPASPAGVCSVQRVDTQRVCKLCASRGYDDRSLRHMESDGLGKLHHLRDRVHQLVESPRCRR
mmetsp:Transcript_61472/g.168925  ORF Transcript_61472/g.168925 Transcript_61472/m.168925 type:complete len:133 (+) Transcript_61472:1399-1797(+)|eukprot:3154089-Prymnesium_polylepis.1